MNGMYRLKHIPSGLYYQPTKSGSTLSLTGKIYSTATHGLSSAFKEYKRDKKNNIIIVHCRTNSRILTKSESIAWEKSLYHINRLVGKTNVSDWTVEVLD